MMITRTPLRISLIGGGTDMASFYKVRTGAVVSFAINKYVYISVNKKFDGRLRVSYSKTETVNHVDELQHELVRESLRLFNIQSGLEITSISDIPGNGTGLGSSSAFTVGLLNALGKIYSPSQLAERAFTVEAEKCNHPVGKQDAYASAHGGMNYFIFKRNAVSVHPIDLPINWQADLESHSLLLWTGIARDANEILKVQSKGFSDGGNVEIGKHMASLASEFYVQLLNGMEMRDVGQFLGEAWKLKKFLAHGITNHKVDAWYDIAMVKGAYGGKLLGAGGGGFLYFIAPSHLHEAITTATGLRRVDFNLETEGSKIIHET